MTSSRVHCAFDGPAKCVASHCVQIGFNWGAAGVSTSVWKGVSLRDVLLKCGVKKPRDGANHVCFVGVEKMPNGRCEAGGLGHTDALDVT